MKKIYTLGLLVLFFSTTQAQVPNARFEEFSGYGNETRFWGAQPILIPVAIDPNGNTVTDEIQYGGNVPSTCFYISDAFDGNRAMEIRNAYNVTKNQSISGKMILFNEDGGSNVASGWNNGFVVGPNADFQIFGFYYKFFPFNNDQANATLELFDENGESIGGAISSVLSESSDYNYVYSYVQIMNGKTPAFMTVEFYMSNPTGQTSLQSRLIIDKVITNFSALQNTENQSNSVVSVYPTLTDDELILDASHSSVELKNGNIIDIQGKLIQNMTLDSASAMNKINVSNLSAGMYFALLETNQGKIIQKFIKK